MPEPGTKMAHGLERVLQQSGSDKAGRTMGRLRADECTITNAHSLVK
jgi:hypothetical protein